MQSIDIQLRWGDFDQYRHVNNVRYAQFLEDARVRLMHQPIGDFAPSHPRTEECIWDLLRPGLATFVARQEIEYREPIAYSPDPVQVRIGVSSVGGSSFDFAYEVLSEGRLRSVAEVSCVVVDAETGRPSRIPAEMREALAALACDPAPLRRRKAS